MNNDSSRPDPEELLDSIEAEKKKAQRGKLKIFFGSSAGVGKTYAMLSAAREKLSEGVNVVVGVAETHNRPETEKLLEGMEILPLKQVNYRGVKLREFDLDAALKRKPEIVLVDELAHTNAPTSRHPKRWNDVEELLDAGIDVYTTLNVQHIESLADIVAGSVGVWVKETVPDSIFDTADDVVLVDIDADDLLKRLAEGKVYVAPGVKARAAENFFRKSNLIALRELALRRTAERVDAEMEGYIGKKGDTARIPVAEKILVCIGPDPLSAKLVRSAKRLSSALKAPWEAVYVENERHYFLSDLGRRKVESLFRMVERIGGKTNVIQGDDAAEAIVSYARDHYFTKILVGKPIRPFWQTVLYGSLADKIIRKSGYIDVYVITGDFMPSNDRELKRGLSDFEKRAYLWAIIAAILATLPGIIFRDFFAPIDQALVYLTGIVIVAAALGRGAALLYALLSVAAFNYFFVIPVHEFSIKDRSYLLTLVIMLITGYVIANQASKLRTQMLLAREREHRTRVFYSLTRELTYTRGRNAVATAAARHVSEMCNAKVTIWLSDDDGNLTTAAGELPAASFVKERSVLQWSFDNAKIAGRGTETMPSAEGLYFPLTGSSGIFGVLGVFPYQEDRTITLDEISSLETMASLITSAFERVKVGEAAAQTRAPEEDG